MQDRYCWGTSAFSRALGSFRQDDWNITKSDRGAIPAEDRCRHDGSRKLSNIEVSRNPYRIRSQPEMQPNLLVIATVSLTVGTVRSLFFIFRCYVHCI